MSQASFPSAIDQPIAKSQGGAYAFVVADIGSVVFATAVGAQGFSLNTTTSLVPALLAGRTLILTVQCTGAATALTITPEPTTPATTINGAAAGAPYVAAVGRTRVSLFSLDGVNWFTG